MAKTRRIMEKSLPLVDIIIEIIDARIPASSRNPELDKIIKSKPRALILNKADYADPNITAQWRDYFKNKGIASIAADCRSGKGLKALDAMVSEVLAPLLERRKNKGMQGTPIQMMVVGIPNVGKSSFINRMSGSKKTQVADRPGVTRGKQWVTLDNGMNLLDMPGVLWPKFEDKQVGEYLAFTGAIKDDILDIEHLAVRFLEVVKEQYSEKLAQRYSLDINEIKALSGYELLGVIGRKRGMLLPGGEINTERAAIMLLDEFRGGKIGAMSLERPDRD